MKKLWILLALGVALGTACNEDDTTDPAPVSSEIGISGFDPTQMVPLEGDVVEVTVESSATWRLTGKKTWCRPSIVEGKSGEKVAFTVDPNDTGDSRSIVYKFFCGNKTVPFTVTQAPAKIFGIDSDSEVEVATAGGNVIVKLSSNIEYTFKVEDDGKTWITAPETRSVTSGRVTFRVQANPDFAPRTGHITFTANGKDYPVTVNQAQCDKLTIDQKDFNVVTEGETISVKIATNVDYTVEVEAAASGWIHRDAAPAPAGVLRAVVDRTETFTIDASKAPRSGKITFRSPDGALRQVVSVNQEGPSVEYAEFPDAAFATWLKGKGWIIDATDAPGKYLITETGLALTEMVFQAQAIATTKGIEAFPNLVKISGANCRVAHYELGSSKVWEIFIVPLGNITSVKVSSENLTDIIFGGKIVTSIDVSGCSKLNLLKVLSCTNLATIYLKQGQEIGSIQKLEACSIVYK